MPRYQYSTTSLNDAASQGFDLGVEGRRKRSLLEEEERRKQEYLEQSKGADLQRLLAGEAYKSQIAEETAAREGDQKALAIDDVLRGDLALARRLGRTQPGKRMTQQPDEILMEPREIEGPEEYRPLAGSVRGKGAGEAAGLLKERMKELSRADSDAERTQALIATLEGRATEGAANRASREKIADMNNRAAAERTTSINARHERVAAAANALKKALTTQTEAGKNARTGQIAGAMLGRSAIESAYTKLGEMTKELSEAQLEVEGLKRLALDDPSKAPLIPGAERTVVELSRIIEEMRTVISARQQQAVPTLQQNTPTAPPKAGQKADAQSVYNNLRKTMSAAEARARMQQLGY